MHIHVKNRIKNTDNPFRSSDLGVMSPQSEMGCQLIPPVGVDPTLAF